MRHDKKPADMPAEEKYTELQKQVMTNAINYSNLKKEFIEQEVKLKLGERKFYFEDLKHLDQKNPDCWHREISAFLPSETVPAGFEEIKIKDRHSFETASLYASYICDQKDFRYNESTVNPALLMFKLKENRKDNFNKLKSHLYHEAMLVHVDDEIYLLRKDQEKLVSMIFPGRKITSVLALKKDFSGDKISHEIENSYYDFTEDDVNRTLKCLDIMPERQKGSQLESRTYNTRFQEKYSSMSTGKRTREEGGLEIDQRTVKKTMTEINSLSSAAKGRVSNTDRYIGNTSSSSDKSLGI